MRAESYLCGSPMGRPGNKLVEWGRPTCPGCFARGLDLKEAQSELSNRIYEAARLLEELEYAGKVIGNGHHMRQQLCQVAERLLADRWAEKAPEPQVQECGCPDKGPEFEKHHPRCPLA